MADNKRQNVLPSGLPAPARSGRSYPAAILSRTVVFPGETAPLVIEGKTALRTIAAQGGGGSEVVLVVKKNGAMSPVGIAARVMQSWDVAPAALALTVEGLRRVRIERVFIEAGADKALVSEIAQKPPGADELLYREAASRAALEQFKKLIGFGGVIPLAIAATLQEAHLPPDKVSDIIAAALALSFEEKVELLETLDVRKRLDILANRLAREFEIVRTEKKIEERIAKELSGTQREFLLREQMKAIEKELGIYDEIAEYADIEKQIGAGGFPKAVAERAMKELSRLRRMPPAAAETPYIRGYLDWLLEMPWSRKSEAPIDLRHAKNILDADHFGLDKPKERVLEYLAVQKLTKGKSRGNILCFVGPPGTGKTSVGQSIAKALGRSFARVSLGGIRDEAEIRGHRRTYVGALPGRIIQGIRNAGTKNPVFMLDEIDKVGADFRGDPSAALLEVLDPEQNGAFSDHYLEIPFDLSEVFFITTANILDPIPSSLRDRLEVIEFPGYTDEEKFHIARRHVLPKVLEGHGLYGKLAIEDDALRRIITRYTREAGVRTLERKLKEIARKVAKRIAQAKLAAGARVAGKDVRRYLGPEEFEVTLREEKDEVGTATGLAWTPAGGEVIFIEAAAVPGKGNLTITGQLGETMQESAKAALSYVRSRSAELGFDGNFYEHSDVHIHVPSGTIPKDGPSAGVAIATALASMLTRRAVRKEVALTGEVTLSGKILPVGGIKEKILAAHRAGVTEVVLPAENRKHLGDVPAETKRALRFCFVKHMDDVLKIALK